MVVRRIGALALLSGLLAVGCADDRERTLPAETALAGLYGEAAHVRLNGNVVDVRVRQDPAQLRRGGELWAKVGPYIYLFSPQTREIFQDWDGVAAVRVRTFAGGDREVARAMLRRDELTAVTWQEAHARVSRARLEGTDDPGHLAALVRYGEDHTEFEYDPRFVER